MADDSALDLSQLTDDQQLAVQQYTSVTNQELSEALPLLRRCEFNVQIAIARFFDGEPTPINDAPPPSTTASRRSQVLINDIYDSTTSSDRRSRSLNRTYEPAYRITLPENRRVQPAPLLLALLMTPINVVYNLFSRAFSFLPFLPRIWERLLARLSTRGSIAGPGPRRQLGSQDSAARFLREFEETFGSPPSSFLRMGYGQAFDLAKKDLKFLAVVPLAPEHDENDAFVRQVLLSEAVVSFFADPANKSLLWVGSIEDSETFQVASSLALSGFPATAIIAHTPSVSSTAMSVLKRMSGLTSPTEYVAQISAVVTQHGQELNRVRSTRQEQEASRTLREEQNSAYERSLATDRERARKRKEAEEKARREEEKAHRQAVAAETFAQNLANWRSWRAQSLPDEPSSSEPDQVRISVRMMDGERVTRRFRATTPLETLYAFVECYSELQSQTAGNTSPQRSAPPADFKHEYSFQLVSTLPREVHALRDGGTLRERLGRSGNLIVEPIDQLEGNED